MRLGRILLRYRQSRDLTLRTLAAEIGVSMATLSRIEHGKEMDSRTLLRILVWMLEVGE